MDWRIYYDDDSTFSSADGAWEKAPADGVIAVVVRDTTDTWGRFICSGHAPHQMAVVPHPDCPAAHKDTTNEFYIKFPDMEPCALWDLGPTLEKLGVNPRICYHEQILAARRFGVVKFGRLVSQKKWQEIMGRAASDPDFPGKSPRRRSSDFKK